MNSTTVSNVLTLLTYAILIAATVAGMHYNVIDSNAGSLIIGGALTHLGVINAPLAMGNKKVNGNGENPHL